MNNLSDNELVDKFILSKDKDTFGEIYSRYFEDVFAFIYSRVGNKSWSEDIAADTYITLIEVIRSFDKESKLKSFIIGIALNKIRKFWHNNAKLREQSFDETLYFYDEEEFDDVKEKRLSQMVDQILPQLSENSRNVLIQRFINQKTIKETSELLDLSEANVRVIQNRALKKAAVLGNKLLNNDKII